MQVILSVFVCRQKIIFVFVFAFVIFWREGRGPKKNILKKWRGEPKCGFLIIEHWKLKDKLSSGAAMWKKASLESSDALIHITMPSP